jgi:hypothetical protein
MRQLSWGLTAIVAVLAVGVGGCGGDDDDDDGAERAQPARLAISLKTSGDEARFTLPDSIPAGLTRIEFTTDLEEDPTAQFLRYDGERTADEVAQAGEAWGGEGGELPDWLHLAGGAGTAAPGATTVVTQELAAGNYYVFDLSTETIAPLRVTGEGDAGELPEPSGVITMREYTFEAKGLDEGRNRVLVENAGDEPHLVSASRLKPGATIDDVRRSVEEEGEEESEPPVEDEGAFLTSITDGGVRQVAELELQAGRYALICFVPDRAGGPPHVARGMIGEAVVR